MDPLRLIENAKSAYSSIAGFAERAERAAEIIRNPKRQIFRQAFESGEGHTSHVVYWVPSSEDYAVEMDHAAPPYYRIELAIGAHPNDYHRCECEDWKRTYRADLNGGKAGAPFVKNQIMCKHIIAAVILEKVRQDEKTRKAADIAAREKAEREHRAQVAHNAFKARNTVFEEKTNLVDPRTLPKEQRAKIAAAIVAGAPTAIATDTAA